MSDLGFNVWGVITGVIGTLTIIPAFLAFLHTRLPTSLLPAVIKQDKETRTLFDTALRKGLITDEGDIYEFKINLLDTEIRVAELRAEVYAATTWWQDVTNWWFGLSSKITVLRGDLNSIRVKLARRNSKELKRMASQELVSELPLFSDSKGPRTGVPSARTPVFLSETAPPRCATATHQYHNPPYPSSAEQSSPRYSCSCVCTAHAATHAREEYNSPGDTVCAAHLPRHIAPNAQSAPDMLSDQDLEDLEGLLSLALQPSRSMEFAEVPGARLGYRHLHAWLQLSKQLFGLSEPDGIIRDVGHTQQRAIRNRLRLLLRLIRRVYGVDPRDVGKTSDLDALLDPESLLPQAMEADDPEHDDRESE
ncbi:hypothetical protein ONZ51_g5117 [Trametes cubensis]|uniref:Uncharacterized protein n=1 Tax=Trametes cubensis TaxID=1111947 RepID=A0AAD7X9P5_9APHY|nr:hypothetical protein ONZ51_g5117 [Trametes cubensis]